MPLAMGQETFWVPLLISFPRVQNLRFALYFYGSKLVSDRHLVLLLLLQATAALLRPQLLNLKTTYRDDETSFFIQTYYSPVLIPLFPPPITASLSRRFFRDSLTEGTIILNTGPQTQLTFNVVSPKPFDFTSDRGPKKLVTNRAGSISGFGVGVRYWSYGATLAGLLSCLRAEWGVTFTELALQVKLGLELGLLGLGILLTGAWDGESAGVAASVGLNAEGVSMKLTCVCLL